MSYLISTLVSRILSLRSSFYNPLKFCLTMFYLSLFETFLCQVLEPISWNWMNCLISVWFGGFGCLNLLSVIPSCCWVLMVASTSKWSSPVSSYKWSEGVAQTPNLILSTCLIFLSRSLPVSEFGYVTIFKNLLWTLLHIGLFSKKGNTFGRNVTTLGIADTLHSVDKLRPLFNDSDSI